MTMISTDPGYSRYSDTDFGPSPGAGASVDGVVNELPMDFNKRYIWTNGGPVNPHARRPYSGHVAHTERNVQLIAGIKKTGIWQWGTVS